MEIAIQSSDEREQVRTRLCKMTDAQLVSFGKAARSLCRNRDCPDTFKRQLKEARAEWRPGHPKTSVRLAFIMELKDGKWPKTETQQQKA